MGTSTDAILCYGISVDEGDELPWSDRDKYDDGIYDWWIEESRWKPSIQPYDEDGEPLPNVSKEAIDRYHQERYNFSKTHPLPIELVEHCSYEYPMSIIAVPGTVTRASRGFPEAIDEDAIKCPAPLSDIAAMREFCKKYSIAGEEGWWLASMWG